MRSNYDEMVYCMGSRNVAFATLFLLRKAGEETGPVAAVAVVVLLGVMTCDRRAPKKVEILSICKSTRT